MNKNKKTLVGLGILTISLLIILILYTTFGFWSKPFNNLNEGNQANVSGGLYNLAKTESQINTITFSELPEDYKRKVAPNDLTGKDISRNPFGIQTTILQDAVFGRNSGVVDNTLRAVKDAGFSMVKDVIVGCARKRNDGTVSVNQISNGCDWNTMDNRFNTFFTKSREFGLKPMIRLDFRFDISPDISSKKIQTNNGLEYPYTIFVREMVKKYGSYVKDWELMNEPNLWGTPQSGGADLTLYKDIAIEAAKAIKKQDPSARVYAPAVSTIGDSMYSHAYTGSVRCVNSKAPQGYIKGLGTDFLKAIDVFSVHNYRSRPEVASVGCGENKYNGITYLKQARDLRSMINSYVPNMPISISETGYPANANTVPSEADLTELAKKTQRTMILDFVAGFKPVILYTLLLRDRTYDGVLEPTFASYREMNFRFASPNKNGYIKEFFQPYYASKVMNSLFSRNISIKNNFVYPSGNTGVQFHAFENLSDTKEIIVLFWKPGANNEKVNLEFRDKNVFAPAYYNLLPNKNGEMVAPQNMVSVPKSTGISISNVPVSDSVGMIILSKKEVFSFSNPESVTINPSNFTSCIFNAREYADHYPDLKRAFGYNTSKLRSHYLNNGIREGRTPCGRIMPSCSFSSATYFNINSGINTRLSAFGHYKRFGIKGRRFVCFEANEEASVIDTESEPNVTETQTPVMPNEPNITPEPVAPVSSVTEPSTVNETPQKEVIVKSRDYKLLQGKNFNLAAFYTAFSRLGEPVKIEIIDKLPAGLTINNVGRLVGTPTVQNKTPRLFKVRATGTSRIEEVTLRLQVN